MLETTVMSEEQRREEEQRRLLVGAGREQPNYEFKPVQYDDLVADYPSDSPFKEEHYVYTGWNVVYQGTFGTFIWMARFLNEKVKFFMATASIPVEVINFLITLKKLVGREKPWFIFTAVVLPLMALITTMVMIDLIRFGVITAGPLMAFLSAGPFIFTGALALFGVLNLMRARTTYIEWRDAGKDGTRTHLHTIRLASRITKTLALFALSGLIAPFMLATVANPFGAIFYAVAITAVLATVIVLKIWKTRQETKAWSKTLQDVHVANEDPYEVLGINRTTLHELIEEKKKNSGFTKLKNMFYALKVKLVGTEEEKAELKNKLTPGSYVKARLNNAIKGKDATEIAKLTQYAELIRKERGREMLEKYQWQKAIHDLKGQDPYTFLGFHHDEREKMLAKQEPVGRVKRFFGMVPESEEVNAEIIAKHQQYIAKPDRTPEQLKLAKHILDMLLKREGRDKYEEYDAAKPVNHTREVREVVKPATKSPTWGGDGEGLQWIYGHPTSRKGANLLGATTHQAGYVPVVKH